MRVKARNRTCKVSIDEGKGAYGDKTRKAHQARINDGEGVYNSY